MTILNFLLQLMSGAMLLLFAVRFMRIGIERLWSAPIRAGLNERSTMAGNLLRGTGLGFAMQGATVVMLMAASLAGSGTIPAASAAIIGLGADLGSALAVQFLQLPISALGPLAVLVGATLYLRSPHPRQRNYGRTVLGLGLIFLSLTIIRSAVEPIGSLPGTEAVVDYFNRDVVTAALAGAALTFLMHSSVAAILTAVAFAGHTTLGPLAGLGFVLGCNLGSSLLPVWLMRAETGDAKVVVYSVAAIRSGAALPLILFAALAGPFIADRLAVETTLAILGGHVLFNVMLMALAPLCARLVPLLESRMTREDPAQPVTLVQDITADRQLASSALKRHLGRMLETAAAMLNEVASEAPARETVITLERGMNADLASLRNAYARLPGDDGMDLMDVQQLMDFAIKVERCGNMLAGKFLALKLDQIKGDYSFSPEGEQEIVDLIAAVRKAILLAQETCWSGDVDAAQALVRHKHDVADQEARSRANHFARLRRGNVISFASSDQHIEMIATLKELNSKFATIGYAVLDRHGGLKKTRLKGPVAPAAS